MPRRLTRTAAINRIEAAGEKRAEQIARKILLLIHLYAPYDEDRRPDRRGQRHLKNSYYAQQDPVNGDWLIKSTRPYWKFVEFGTAEHGNAQPHVRPAIEEARRRYR